MRGAAETPRESSVSAQRHRLLMLGNGWFPDVPGGLNRYFRDFYEASVAADLRPRAVLLGPAHCPAAGVTVAAAQKTSLPLRVLRYAWAVRAAKAQAEIIDSHFALYAVLPTLAGLMRDRLHVVHFHGPWAAESEALTGELRPKLRAKFALERFVYARAAALIVLSGAFRDVLITQYGIPSQRVHVIPPGVNLEVFTPGEQSGARERLGLPRDAWIASCVRRLVPRMGIDVLLEAWRSFAEHPQSQPSLLLIAGDGDRRDALSARASQLGLGESVRFLGGISDADLVTLHQAADVSLVPSLALEGFGLVVLEALACGTPVIVTDAGGLPESVRPLDRSLVVPAHDSQAIAHRLLAARDGSQPLPSRERCRSHAERFSWSAAVETHQRLFDSLLGAPREGC
jgi:glycosyltransferase involved in cell wall biosynthesis